MYFQPMPVRFEPAPNARVFVIRGIVLNEDRSLTPVSPRQLLHEAHICRSVENNFLGIVELGAPEFDGAENFHTLALAGYQYSGWTPDAAPRGMQCRVLAEAGFVSKDQRRTLRPGFFLILG